MIESAHINEVYEPDGEARGFYRPLLEILGHMGPEDFAGRRARARVLLKDLGATFPLPGESDDRVLPADWMPRITRKTTGRSSPPDSCNAERRSTPGSPTSTTAASSWSPTK